MPTISPALRAAALYTMRRQLQARRCFLTRCPSPCVSEVCSKGRQGLGRRPVRHASACLLIPHVARCSCRCPSPATCVGDDAARIPRRAEHCGAGRQRSRDGLLCVSGGAVRTPAPGVCVCARVRACKCHQQICAVYCACAVQAHSLFAALTACCKVGQRCGLRFFPRRSVPCVCA